jgi:hypothetical protein
MAQDLNEYDNILHQINLITLNVDEDIKYMEVKTNFYTILTTIILNNDIYYFDKINSIIGFLNIFNFVDNNKIFLQIRQILWNIKIEFNNLVKNLNYNDKYKLSYEIFI